MNEQDRHATTHQVQGIFFAKTIVMKGSLPIHRALIFDAIQPGGPSGTF